MDKSKIYIKMCDCPEIQNRGHDWDGSYVSPRDGFGVGVTFWKKTLFTSGASLYADFGHGIYDRVNTKNHIWLPRQDQLQEMIGTPLLAFGKLWFEFFEHTCYYDGCNCEFVFPVWAFQGKEAMEEYPDGNIRDYLIESGQKTKVRVHSSISIGSLSEYTSDWECGILASKFSSMEQLWLAFAMNEKHNKMWDGDKWIAKTDN